MRCACVHAQYSQYVTIADAVLLQYLPICICRRMISPRCWQLPPTLGRATARRRWRSTSSRRRWTGSTSSTWGRPGRRSSWLPGLSPPWRIPVTSLSAAAGPSLRDLSSSLPGRYCIVNRILTPTVESGVFNHVSNGCIYVRGKIWVV